MHNLGEFALSRPARPGPSRMRGQLRAAKFVIVLALGPRSPARAQQRPDAPSSWVQLRNATDNRGTVSADLRVSWTYRAAQTIRGLAIAHNTVFLGTAPNNSETAAAETGKADTSGSVIAIDVATGRVKWMTAVPSWVHGDPVVFRDHVVVTFGRLPANVPGGVWCLDGRTGKVLWKYATAAGTMPSAAIDTATGTVLEAGDDGVLQSLSLMDGHLIRSWGLLSAVSMSSPRIDTSGTVVIGSKYRVSKYDSRGGRLLWRSDIELGGISDVPVAIANGLIFTTGVEDLGLKAGFHVLPLRRFIALARASAASHPIAAGQLWFRRQWLVAIDAITGRVVWRQPLGIGLPLTRNQAGAPAVVGSTVYVASPVSRTAFAFDSTGKMLWQRELPGRHRGAPTVIADDVIFGDDAGELSILSRDDGQVVGGCRGTTPFTVFSPILVGQTVFVASRDGWLYARPYTKIRAAASSPGNPACFDSQP